MAGIHLPPHTPSNEITSDFLLETSTHPGQLAQHNKRVKQPQ